MAMTFKDFVDYLLSKRRWSPGDLAERLGYGGAGYLHNIIHGKRPPPLKRIDEWIDKLQLDEDDAIAFRLAAEREHVPPYTLARIEQHQRRLERAEAALADLKRDLAEAQRLLADQAQLRRELDEARAKLKQLGSDCRG